MVKDLSSVLGTDIRWFTTVSNSSYSRSEVLASMGAWIHANANTNTLWCLLVNTSTGKGGGAAGDPVSVLPRGSDMCMHGFYMKVRDLNTNPQALTNWAISSATYVTVIFVCNRAFLCCQGLSLLYQWCGTHNPTISASFRAELTSVH